MTMHIWQCLTILSALVTLGCCNSMIIVTHWVVKNFKATVTLPVPVTTNQWQMKLTFDKPVALSDDTLWTASLVSQIDNKNFIVKNKYNTMLYAGDTFTMDFNAKYLTTNEPPTTSSGTYAQWDGGVSTDTTPATTPDTTPATIPDTTPDATTPNNGGGSGYDYGNVLSLSMLFYEAQRSGDLPSDNVIPWRGDSSVSDGSDVGMDLSGGWHNAGDYKKFGFPMASSATMLLTGMVFFKDGYQSAGQMNMAKRQLKWPLDYFLKCFDESNNRFAAQVGNGTIDHNWMGRPEDMLPGNPSRPTYFVGSNYGTGGADVCGQTAAALAAGSVVWKTDDAAYSTQLLNAAKDLYTMAKGLPAPYQTVVTDAAQFYSSDEYKDDLAHAAAWLAYAHIGINQSLVDSYQNEVSLYLDAGTPWALSWSDKRVLVNALMHEMTNGTAYKSRNQQFLQQWLPGGSVTITPGGLAWRDQWGSLRYAANAAFAALLQAKIDDDSALIQWAQSQINYALGDSGRSYVVGYGVNPPSKPHHKAAFCPSSGICTWNNFNNNGISNAHQLTGALVGGPDEHDNYADFRTDFVKNEVACDYNAGFSGALAGLIYFEDRNPSLRL